MYSSVLRFLLISVIFVYLEWYGMPALFIRGKFSRKDYIAPTKRLQHFDATLLGAACCAHLTTLLWYVVTCCDLLGVVGSNLKLVKFFMQHLFMLHAVENFCTWPCVLVRFSIPNMPQQGGQTRVRCCAQQSWDMLCGIVAIVWQGIANFGPTMLRHAVLICWVILWWYAAIVSPAHDKSYF